MAKTALGRGLGALMGSAIGQKPEAPATSKPAELVPAPEQPAADEQVRRVAAARIQRSPLQPRKDFAVEALQELADSIREQGILQPLVVRQRNGGYELIAGERRWRAAQMAGLLELPVLIREADDRKVLELALIENLQRENLNPVEEALGYSRLIADFSLTQEEAAAKVGKNRVTVTNLLRLLQLPAEIQNHVRSGLLSFGHARALLGLQEAALQKLAAERVIRDRLSVRDTEQWVAEQAQAAGHTAARHRKSGGASQPSRGAAAQVDALQNRLQERFGSKVLLKYRQGKGAIEIRFFSDDDLERILGIAGVNID